MNEHRRKQHGALFVLVLAFLLTNALAARADFVSAPVTGAAVVTTSHFTNIYFFPNPSQQTWEQHLASLSAAGSAVDTSETRAAIDNFVLTLTHTSYFDRLSQYNAGIAGAGGPINPPLFAGEQQTAQACVDAALKTVTNNVVGFDTLRAFAVCQNAEGHNPSDQVNIILSPEFDAANIFQTKGICGEDTAFHASFPVFNTPNFTVIPTNSKCNASFAFLAESISHEMVETISDPAGFGYIHETQPARFIPDPSRGFSDDISSEFSEGELADICQKGGLKNPGSDPNIWAITVFGLPVARYWSNMDTDCEPQPGLMVAPQPPIGTLPINRLQFDILTGNDGLGTDSTATASVIVNGSPVPFRLKLSGDHSWDNNTDHVRTFELPATVPVSALGNVTIAIQQTNEDWSIQALRVTPMLSTPNPTSGLPDIVTYATCLVDVSGEPFARLAGSNQSAVTAPFSGCPSAPAVKKQVDQASVRVVTGGDDLRGDSSATLVMSVNGKPASFVLKAENEAGWGNDTVHTKVFPLGAPALIDNIGPMAIALQSHVTAPETGDNWNIQSVTANLSIGGRNATCYANTGGNPFARLTGDRPSVLVLAFTGCAAADELIAWGTSTRYETGGPDAVAMDNNGDAVEVHVGSGKLYYRVGTIDAATQTVAWGASIQYDTGGPNAVAMDNNGDVVEVHVGSGKLYYRVGKVNVAGQTIPWGTSTEYDTGGPNAVAMDSNGDVVEVHVGSGKLYYRVGKINVAGQTIAWGTSTEYETGGPIAVAMDSNGDVVEVHVGSGKLYSRVGTIDVASQTIAWGASIQYDTGGPSAVAMDNNGDVVEVHVGSGRLYSLVGKINAANRTVAWGESVEYDAGSSNSVAMDNNGDVVEVHANSGALFFNVGHLGD
jgi:hypothetical protein